ncbi:hypothetical protein ACFYT3_05420 [Nocardia amikacinitolerans]|uniref:hypothetical protein n=1 Tax=Nocardia amikacinitolerans TaxID=756689 RepID=UPI00367DD624
MVADRLTRDLADDYEDDPVLAGMSVPHVKVAEATMTLRYAVSDVVEAEPALPDPVKVGVAWHGTVTKKVLPGVLRKLGISGDDRQTLLQAISIKRPTVSATERALKGSPAELLDVTVESALESWTNIPAELQHRLGGKLAFRAEMKAAAGTALEAFLAQESGHRVLAAVLASTIQVNVAAADLPDDPHRMQEIQLTVTGEDLELFAFDDQEG